MPGSIDDAYVEIHPDAHGFRRELDTDLDAAFTSMERKLDNVVDSIEHQFDRLIDQLDLHFHHLTNTIHDAGDEIQFQVRETGADIGTYIEAGAEVARHAIDDLADSADHDFNRIKRHARSAGEETGTSFIGGLLSKLFGARKELETAGASGGSSGGGFFSGLTGLLGGGGDIGGLIKVGLIAAAIPIVLSLGAALSQLLGLLALIPGVIGVVVAAIAPLIIAFKGVGAAIGAGFSGNAEQFKKALKGLAEPAQKVVKEIVGLKSQLSDIKKNVQSAFFAPLIGQFSLLGKTLLPVLNSGLTTVASALGRFASGLLSVLSNSGVIKDINALFSSTGRIVDQFAPTAARLFKDFFDVMAASLPFVERMFSALNGGLQKFAGWLEKSMQNGDFTGFLEDAFRVAGELGDLLKSVGGLLGTLFGNADQQAAGEDFIKSLQQAIDKLNEFFKSAKGQETLKALAETTKFLGKSLIQTVEIFAGFISGINTIVHALIDFWGWLKKIPGAIADFFIAIGSGISGAFSAVVGFFGRLGEMARGWASSFFNFLVDAFVGGWHRVTSTVSTFISVVTGLFTGFPAMMRSIFASVFSIVASIWESIRSIVVSKASALWSGVVGFISRIPGAISDFFSSARNKAISIAESLRAAVVSKISQLVSGARSEASKLPGQISSALSSVIGRATQIGRDIINGMVNGIRGAAGRLASAAKDAVIDGLNAAKRALGANSPSKEYAKLGADTVRGYNMGQDQEMQKDDPFKLMPKDAFSRSSATAQPQSTSVSVGGAQIVAYLQIGDDQLHPVVIKAIEQNPQAVSLAVENGDSQLARRR